jgi:hypothetical protein
MASVPLNCFYTNAQRVNSICKTKVSTTTLQSNFNNLSAAPLFFLAASVLELAKVDVELELPVDVVFVGFDPDPDDDDEQSPCAQVNLILLIPGSRPGVGHSVGK